MEIMMMKTRALLLALLITVAAQAQVTYSLPATAVTLEVTAVQETYVAGPYAKYAKQYLGIDVPMQDCCTTTVTEIKLSHALVADPSSTYTISSWKGDSKFLALTSQGLVAFENASEASGSKWFVIPPSAPQGDVAYSNPAPSSAIEIPIPWEVAPNKPAEYLAKDAAEVILAARRERYNITIGNTDATFSGESLGAALEELRRLEEEYLPLFTGKKTETVIHRSFTVCPDASRRNQHYPVFAVSDEGGLLPSSSDGTVYYLDFSSELLSTGAVPTGGDQKNTVHYRVPSVCQVTLSTDDGGAIYSTRIPVYQLGRELTMPAK